MGTPHYGVEMKGFVFHVGSSSQLASQVEFDLILVWLIWSSSFITPGVDAVLIGRPWLVQSYFILFAIISPAQH